MRRITRNRHHIGKGGNSKEVDQYVCRRKDRRVCPQSAVAGMQHALTGTPFRVSNRTLVRRMRGLTYLCQTNSTASFCARETSSLLTTSESTPSAAQETLSGRTRTWRILGRCRSLCRRGYRTSRCSRYAKTLTQGPGMEDSEELTVGIAPNSYQPVLSAGSFGR